MVSNYPQPLFLPRLVPHLFNQRHGKRQSTRSRYTTVCSPSLSTQMSTIDPTPHDQIQHAAACVPKKHSHHSPMSTASEPDPIHGTPDTTETIPILQPHTQIAAVKLLEALIKGDSPDLQSVHAAISKLGSGNINDHLKLVKLLRRLFEANPTIATEILDECFARRGQWQVPDEDILGMY